eukprot:TRINITY_DN3889_c1_g1_i1.p1 TRINITY_DN3889_c1_g1~~TRINITY_DN3889_c1_g1_i1.p1  ORF type:complete len:150 (+),score=47.41 TRINITY_DN3889_c1_g1_i1:274-723(+)
MVSADLCRTVSSRGLAEMAPLSEKEARKQALMMRVRAMSGMVREMVEAEQDEREALLSPRTECASSMCSQMRLPHRSSLKNPSNASFNSRRTVTFNCEPQLSYFSGDDICIEETESASCGSRESAIDTYTAVRLTLAALSQHRRQHESY